MKQGFEFLSMGSRLGRRMGLTDTFVIGSIQGQYLQGLAQFFRENFSFQFKAFFHFI